MIISTDIPYKYTTSKFGTENRNLKDLTTDLWKKTLFALWDEYKIWEGAHFNI